MVVGRARGLCFVVSTVWPLLVRKSFTAWLEKFVEEEGGEEEEDVGSADAADEREQAGGGGEDEEDDEVANLVGTDRQRDGAPPDPARASSVLSTDTPRGAPLILPWE
jgi:hypothetical protein